MPMPAGSGRVEAQRSTGAALTGGAGLRRATSVFHRDPTRLAEAGGAGLLFRSSSEPVELG
jgi:hypothetical protein